MSVLGGIRFVVLDVLRGTRVVALLNTLKKLQFQSPDELESLMLKRLDAYSDKVKGSCEIYRSIESFAGFPVIDKSFAMLNAKVLANKNYGGKVFRKKTGGSTGEPFVYHTGVESQSYLWAGIFLSWSVAGYQLGERVAFLAGSSVFGAKIGWRHRVYYGAMNVDLMSAFEMSNETMSGYIEALASRKTRILYGYASAIHRLAQFANRDRKVKAVYSLRGVFCTAEVLTEVMRAEIEKAFGVACFSQYGCNDAGVSAFECERQQGFHLITTRCYPEVLEGGRFIATDMTNEASFLPRYDTGDRIKWAGRACACGRGFPLIAEVLGRSNDIVEGPNGLAVHSEFFTHLFREDARIAAFQVLFDNQNLAVLVLVRALEFCDWSGYVNLIKAKFAFVDVAFIERSEFVALANGKHRFVMRVPVLSDSLRVIS